MPRTMLKWVHVTLPADGVVDASAAERLMISFQAMSDELGDLVANAIYYEETCKYAYDKEFARAMRESSATSDRRREAEAQMDDRVDMAKQALVKARAVRQFLDMKHESAIRSVHAMKALLRSANEEKWLA